MTVTDRHLTELCLNAGPLAQLHLSNRRQIGYHGYQVFLTLPTVQNQTGGFPKKWDKAGTVVENLDHDKVVVKPGIDDK